MDAPQFSICNFQSSIGNSYLRQHAAVAGACLLAGVAAMLLGGCAGISWKPFASKSDPPAGPAPAAGTHVRVGGDGFALGDVEQSVCTPQQFLQRVGELLPARQTAAAEFVQRHPDVALGILREPGAVPAPPHVLAFVAQVHDRQCSRVEAQAGWSALLADRAAHPDRYAPHDQKRRQFMDHVQNGRVQEALQLGVADTPAGTPGTMLAVDAWRLTGIALVLGGQPQEAAAAFQKALQQAAGHPYQAVNVLLLLSDAQRRSGMLPAAQSTWQDSVRLASELATAVSPVADPILWERAAYARPVQCPWPVDVQQRLDQVNLAFGIVPGRRDAVIPVSTAATPADEAALWTAIGHWRLARDEPQAALAALKRAESMTSQSWPAARLQLAQAKALARLGQAQAATAVLIRLASNGDPQIARPATAMLGTMKLQQGGVQQGFNLLRRAGEEDPSLFWPERPEAEADLGLAYLLVGDENAGLRWLHGAQQAFEASGQHEPLVQCLENEAAYLDQAKKTDLAKAVRRRIECLQSGR